MPAQSSDNMVIQPALPPGGPAKRIQLSTLKTFFLSVATTTALGAVKVGTGLSVDGNGKLNATGTTSPAATDAVAGIVKLATAAEASGGTVAGVVVDPVQLKTALSAYLPLDISTLNELA